MIKENKRLPNNLISEHSPYLLQHAHNPVNWYPWEKEAFQLAKQKDIPIFLSIGYSTCHWCHVMEKESFEDEDVARMLNDTFICIKVDREERPDIDNVYMSVCQMLTGSGGWPLTIIMTPEQKPFFAGTYFPKSSRGNRIGLIELIPKINEVWLSQREDIEISADEITSSLNKDIISIEKNNISLQVVDEAFNNFTQNFDSENGGFGIRPKFPSPHNLQFLLRYYYLTKDKKSLDMVTKTLTEMRKGGIFDQVGLGFHRYSTDKKWFLPHFEKMLYDQAMLIITYTEAYQITEDPQFKRTAEEIIEYILRDMVSPEGGFYSAEDADSEGEEGKFYLWDYEELDQILDKDDSTFIKKIFNFEEDGTFFDEASGIKTGKNLPYLKSTLDEISKTYGNIDFYHKFTGIRKKIFEYRENRIHPYKDDKILSDWNGLIIAALSIAGRVFRNEDYITAAKKTLQFIYNKMIIVDEGLVHRFRNGKAGISAKLDDYAFLIWGLLELYEATYDPSYLEKGLELTETVIDEFWDDENNSGFYFSSKKDSDLILRTKEFYDGAIPSGNSVMFNNLVRFSTITTNSNLLRITEQLALTYSKLTEKSPSAYGNFLSGLIHYLGESFEIILTGDKENPQLKNIFTAICSSFLPNKVILYVSHETTELLDKINSNIKSYQSDFEIPMVFVCKNYECNLPTNDIKEVMKLLNLK